VTDSKPSKSARKREQLALQELGEQLIALNELMRNIDPEPVREELTKLQADDVRSKRIFTKAERWRDRIVRHGSVALLEFETETREQDDELRALLAELKVAFNEKTEKTVRRKIFRRLHEILVRIPQ